MYPHNLYPWYIFFPSRANFCVFMLNMRTRRNLFRNCKIKNNKFYEPCKYWIYVYELESNNKISMNEINSFLNLGFIGYNRKKITKKIDLFFDWMLKFCSNIHEFYECNTKISHDEFCDNYCCIPITECNNDGTFIKIFENYIDYSLLYALAAFKLKIIIKDSDKNNNTALSCVIL